jgi:hypothetical protein
MGRSLLGKRQLAHDGHHGSAEGRWGPEENIGEESGEEDGDADWLGRESMGKSWEESGESTCGVRG